ncbi:uncharacterized protein LOC9628907 isoform X2 [Selaginella moellendorffii]|uniref:uncharacterized protein LOC9628907 isoform X2 n=1 Tax=Selaginella moellendorffii TaxID=88036 RepID=UPI000D1D0589|nr:uncharacterized protein LOC9628907 isoform X2 [Selaginella moellendorffii]|eukprot:XP_024518627.1 uncharacterized protein LOC9628907 isoform X2 [Selaginella moellendorffii]
MGATESRSLKDEITTISESKGGGVDPNLKALHSLKAGALLPGHSSPESGLKEILLGQSSPSQTSVENLSLDATATAELFSLYHEWQKENATKLCKRQEDLGYRIEAVEELALKLFQRLGHSASVMRTTASHLDQVGKLRSDVKDMKQILETTLHEYNSLCKNIHDNGPEFLKPSAKPFSASDFDNSPFQQ